MTKSHVSLAVGVAAIVLLAGCMGGLLGDGQSNPTPTATADDSTVPATHGTQNISVTNYQFAEVVVIVQAVQRPVTELEVTYRNGSVRTDSIEDYGDRMVWSYGLGDGVASVEAVNTTDEGRWSAVVERNATVSLPTVANNQNVSYLIVIYHPAFEQVVNGKLVECRKPFTRLERFELQLGEQGTQSADTHASTSCQK